MYSLPQEAAPVGLFMWQTGVEDARVDELIDYAVPTSSAVHLPTTDER